MSDDRQDAPLSRDVTTKSGQTQAVNPKLEDFATTLPSTEPHGRGAEIELSAAQRELFETFGEPPTVFSLGVEYETGQYHRRPATTGSFAWSTGGKTIRAGGGREPRAGVDPDQLAQAGWGVLFADESAREPLRPLLELRRRQAGERFRELHYQPGQSAQAFLNAHNAPPGPADPERAAPYYLTLVGDPETIPFHFQQELDVRYAVGRLAFDRPEDYAAYAAAVIAAEQGETRRSRNTVFFGVEHATDPVTKLCTERLVEPLAGAALARAGWRTQILTGRSADHRSLVATLESAEKPALLLAAGHGLVLTQDSEHQRALQGALLTADWPGPGTGSVRPDQLLSAADLSPRTDVAGLVAILVGCFTAGTPRFDTFAEGRQIALTSAPFVADFAKALLARGALATLGHVDNLYIHSYAWPGAGTLPQHQTFDTLLHHLMAGQRLGHAMDTFGRKYGELAARLLAARLDPGQISDEEYASYWIGYHDTRQYVILGDPAVRLAVHSAA